MILVQACTKNAIHGKTKGNLFQFFLNFATHKRHVYCWINKDASLSCLGIGSMNIEIANPHLDCKQIANTKNFILKIMHGLPYIN